MLHFIVIDVNGDLTQMILNVNGKQYDITNWDEFSENLLKGIGFILEDEIVKKVDDLKLVDSGHYKGGFTTSINKNVLEIVNDIGYAVYLEYGTYDYWKRFGFSGFLGLPDPKKKHLTAKRKAELPKGMQPFAPIRRVLWNQNKMNEVIRRGVNVAIRNTK